MLTSPSNIIYSLSLSLSLSPNLHVIAGLSEYSPDLVFIFGYLHLFNGHHVPLVLLLSVRGGRVLRHYY